MTALAIIGVIAYCGISWGFWKTAPDDGIIPTWAIYVICLFWPLAVTYAGIETLSKKFFNG